MSDTERKVTMTDETTHTQQALLSSLPLWMQAVSIVGFPILVAGFYMAKDVGFIPSILGANAEVLSKVVVQHDDHLVFLKESLRLQREVCRNTARSPEAARVCNLGE